MRKKITTTITNDDALFLRTQDIKVSHAIRVFCEERRTGNAKELEAALHIAREEAERKGAKLAGVIKLLSQQLPEKTFNDILEKM